MNEFSLSMVTVLMLAYVQNVAFTMTSRSRNRNNMAYHMLAAAGANGIWFLTMRELLITELSNWMLPGYIIGTVAGSLTGAKVSMFIEKWLGAKTDG